MTQVNGINDAAGLAPPPASGARTSLGQEDFLELMIAQFQNQDPFKPMENGDFLGQLAQFGTVSGIEELNGSFAGLQASLQSEQMLKAATLVGREVLAVSESGYLAEGGSLSGAVELGSSAAGVQVEITDANGELVRRLDLGPQPAGLVRFEWDGRDSDEAAVASGEYAISARVVRGTRVESLETMLEARIDSVNIGRPGQPMTLNLAGGGVLSVAQVRRVY